MATNPDRLNYIAKYKDAAIKATRGTRLFPSVMMAQGILESRNGLSSLTRIHHNHFGIKAGSSWTGARANFRTAEQSKDGKEYFVNDDFRSYPNDEAGFADRISFLTGFKRYQLSLRSETPDQQIQAIKDAGYATDVNYVNLVKQIMRDYNLYALDAEQKKTSTIYIALIILAIVTIIYIALVYFKIIK